MESVISASVIVLVIRSRRPFFKSRPGRYLLMATLIVAGVTLIFPFTPLGRIFGFVSAAPVISCDYAGHCGALYGDHRGGQKDFLSKSEILSPDQLDDLIAAGDKLALVSWEKDGEVCGCTLIKVEGLTDRVKGMLGPIMKEMM